MRSRQRTVHSGNRLRRDTGPSGRGSGTGFSRGHRFAPAELREFREALLAKRRELLGDLTSLRKEASGRSQTGEQRGHPGMSSLAESATDTWEQEFAIGLLERERLLLNEIHDALQRIRNGTYGICEATRRPISKARLRAIPWARYCLEHARADTDGTWRGIRGGR